MSTPNVPNAAPRRSGTRALAVAAALLAAGALAAGCGTTQAGGPAGAPAPTVSATSASAAPSASASASATPSWSTGSAGPAAPSGSAGSAAPVPTVSGGRVTPGVPACAGWPASAPRASLPASFVPVAVERCVKGAETVPGKGLWQTATLQRADSDLGALVSALHQPSGTHQPGTACPMLAIIPPQVVLISATGQALVPQLPVSGCGLIKSQVLAALAALPWRVVSVRLIAPIPEASSSGAVPSGPAR